MIWKLVIPTIVVISIIAIGITIYVEERKDAKRQLKEKENNNV